MSGEAAITVTRTSAISPNIGVSPSLSIHLYQAQTKPVCARFDIESREVFRDYGESAWLPFFGGGERTPWNSSARPRPCGSIQADLTASAMAKEIVYCGDC